MESLSPLLCFSGNIFVVGLGITMQRGSRPSLFSVLGTCRTASRLRIMLLFIRSMFTASYIRCLNVSGTLRLNRNTIAGFIFLILQVRTEMMARLRSVNVFVCLQKKRRLFAKASSGIDGVLVDTWSQAIWPRNGHIVLMGVRARLRAGYKS